MKICEKKLHVDCKPKNSSCCWHNSNNGRQKGQEDLQAIFMTLCQNAQRATAAHLSLRNCLLQTYPKSHAPSPPPFQIRMKKINRITKMQSNSQKTPNKRKDASKIRPPTPPRHKNPHQLQRKGRCWLQHQLFQSSLYQFSKTQSQQQICRKHRFFPKQEQLRVKIIIIIT
jgi:hypothetical protein